MKVLVPEISLFLWTLLWAAVLVLIVFFVVRWMLRRHKIQKAQLRDSRAEQSAKGSLPGNKLP